MFVFENITKIPTAKNQNRSVSLNVDLCRNMSTSISIYGYYPSPEYKNPFIFPFSNSEVGVK